MRARAGGALFFDIVCSSTIQVRVSKSIIFIVREFLVLSRNKKEGVFVKITNITPDYCCVRVRLSTCGDIPAALKKEEPNVFPLANQKIVVRRKRSEKAAPRNMDRYVTVLGFNHITH